MSPTTEQGNNELAPRETTDLGHAAPAISPPQLKVPYCAYSSNRRRSILAIVTVAGCFGPLAGNIYLPALPVLQRAFDVGPTAMNATVSLFMIVFAFAPLFWTSFSDYRGRRPLYIISLAVYIVANILIAAVPANFGALIFLRILQAFGSAAVVPMGAGTVADITEPKHRGKVMSHFLLGPQLGPVLGPLIGGALAETSWRWIFGFLALLGITLWMIVCLALPETLRCRVGNGRLSAEKSWLIWPPQLSTETAPIEEQAAKPPKPTLMGYWRLFKYPPIGIVSFNTAILYATYFCIAVDLPRTLEDVYGWNSASVGASYLAVGVALIIGSLVGGRVNDARRRYFVKLSPKDEVAPETRLIDQIWGVILCASGTLMYGWFIEQKYHPAAVLVSTFLTGFGMSWVFVSSTAFLTECVQQQAAGAFALGNMLRNPAAAIAALLTPSLTREMGIGWFFTGLGILDMIVVGGAVLLLRVRSPYWRAAKAAAAAKPKSGSP
ncbi:putative major facilitator superfamily, MFS transporter superfamily [Septoria linicola]|nr:putative major facilitator superfamily, MFS transporter superfamily [Septoria linicola]